ncbi:hypothetical protein D3C76_1606490 [compost metagenome]
MSGIPPFFYNRMMQITLQLNNEGIGHINDFGGGFLPFVNQNNLALKINLFVR